MKGVEQFRVVWGMIVDFYVLIYFLSLSLLLSLFLIWCGSMDSLLPDVSVPVFATEYVSLKPYTVDTRKALCVKDEVKELKNTTDLILSAVSKLAKSMEKHIGGINDRLTSLKKTSENER